MSQIEKLNSMVVGNRSHFAKYIEVKEENASLMVSQINTN
jgi:hypothetical protein